MSEIGDNTPANGAARKTSHNRRLSRYVVVLLIVLFAAFFLYRGGQWQSRAEIARLGGSTSTGSHPVYAKLAYDTRTPKLIRDACTSEFGRWVFSQFPVVYSVDLRGLRDRDAVESALHIAKNFDHVTELTLYQSAVTDDHLAILGAGFPRLERLKINETAITDAGVTHLRDLPELRMINAQRTALTNAAVGDLAAMRWLRELDIAETRITSVKQIRDAHPMCFINHRLVTLTQSTDHHRVTRP